MVSITALSFSDPLPFQAAISTANLEFLPTTKGQFRAELTKVCMDQLWMHRFDQDLPLINAGAVRPERRVFTFLTSGERPQCDTVAWTFRRVTSSSTTSMRYTNRPGLHAA